MLNKNLLKPEVRSFIRENLHSDPAELILKGSPFEDVDIREIVVQIQGKQKAKKKLPLWFENDKVLFPPQLNLSQSSSQTTALYKAGLVSGEVLADLTGGFGVDSFYFSKRVNKVIHCEQNEEISELAKHNFSVLSTQNNMEFYQGDGIEFITNLDKPVDFIYADPGRRSDSGSKVFRLEDGQPDILKNLDLLLSKCRQILLKTSPFLDLTQGIEQLKIVKEIHVVSVKNEVKELLWIITQNPSENIPVKTVDFAGEQTLFFEGSLLEEKEAKVRFSPPLSYLYEPNTAILKAGFFKLIGQKFNLFKLSDNAHLYTGEQLISFPGRSFKILNIIPVQKKKFKRQGIEKANITVRNFPLSVEQIRKKYKIKDGGKDYLFFTENSNGKHICIHAEKCTFSG